MDAANLLDVDVLIVGGGCAGLWLLDDLRRRGTRVLLVEGADLGSGQTIHAQGILHGGLKYSLAGLLTASAQMVREMPLRWEASLAGRAEPNLSGVRSRASFCYLWRVRSFTSWTTMLAAVTALHVHPEQLLDDTVPAVLADCPRPVYRLDERVIDTGSFLSELARRNAGLIWQIDRTRPLFAAPPSPSAPLDISIANPAGGSPVGLRAQHVVLAAGAGNARLREQLGLTPHLMQRRPLRVALVRGDLPPLSGHCVDGAKTRLTITSQSDSAGRTVWQLGGQVSETGVGLPREEFLQLARRELSAVLPGWRPPQLEWTEYAVDRAERNTRDGMMPGDVQIVEDQRVLTVWPTKLVMAPLASQRVQELLPPLASTDPATWTSQLAAYHHPAPRVATPAWESELSWTHDS